MDIEVSRQIFEKYSIINFKNIRPVTAWLFREDEQTAKETWRS